MMYWALLLLTCMAGTLADYQCLCNYHVEREVYPRPDTSTTPSGYMYEFDCKPIYPEGPDIQNWVAIQYEKQVTYVNVDDQVKVQTCPGNPPTDDLVVMTTPASTKPISTTTTSTTTTSTTTTTSATTSTTTTPTTTSTTTTPSTTSTTTTPTTTSTTTTRPTTTRTTTTIPTTTSTTTRRTTTASTTSSAGPVPHGDITKCPDHIVTDSQRVHGYVNQYDNYCFVLDPQADTWSNAEKHCTQRGGHLLTIRNAQEQEFFTLYLKSHHYVESVFIGLKDDKNEGTYYWSSGAPVTYTNWGPDYSSASHIHGSNDCVVMKANGYWVDTYCGIGIIGGIGVLDKHHFICQYGFDAKLPSIVDFLGDLIGK